MNIDIAAVGLEVGLLGAVTVFMTLVVVLLNKRIDDLRNDIKDDIKALQEGQTQLIASVAWLMARAGATPDEIAPLRQDTPQATSEHRRQLAGAAMRRH